MAMRDIAASPSALSGSLILMEPMLHLNVQMCYDKTQKAGPVFADILHMNLYFGSFDFCERKTLLLRA